MSNNVENKIMNIFGFPGGGKTLLGVIMASQYSRIYSNVDIFRGKRKISRSIKNRKDIENIKYEEKKGILLLDEVGSSANSRRSGSKENLVMGNMAFLSRKKNIDICFIAQLGYSIDKYLRDLAQYEFTVKSFYEDGKKKFIIKTSVKNDIGQENRFSVEKEIDMIRYLNETGINYDTLQDSQLEEFKEENTITRRRVE